MAVHPAARTVAPSVSANSFGAVVADDRGSNAAPL